MAPKTEPGRRVVADNRSARYHYSIEDTFEAGIALTGTEVKSLRSGKATLGEAYAGPSGNDLMLFNVFIPEYLEANRFNHDTKRPRRRLLQRARPGEGRARPRQGQAGPRQARGGEGARLEAGSGPPPARPGITRGNTG